MSRIGKKPIAMPDKVKVSVVGGKISVEGPKGRLSQLLPSSTDVEVKDKVLIVVKKVDTREASALHGLTRAIVANMLQGVSKGFERILDINGVGYRAELKGKVLVLTLGYSHPVEVKVPDGISVKIDKQTTIVLESSDKALLGQFAADIRKLRGPEPYKGKGIKYREEIIKRKAGKAAAK